MSISPIECLATRSAALENANLGWHNPGSLVAPLASHEEGGRRDTAITREQLSAKTWPGWSGGVACCELAGQPDFATCHGSRRSAPGRDEFRGARPRSNRLRTGSKSSACPSTPGSLASHCSDADSQPDKRKLECTLSPLSLRSLAAAPPSLSSARS